MILEPVAHIRSRLEHGGFVVEDISEHGILMSCPNEPRVLLEGSSDEHRHRDYVTYTTHQNRLMCESPHGLLRFTVTPVNTDDVLRQFERLVDEEWSFAASARHGVDRERFSIDPTQPEHLFELGFEEAFGRSALHALAREAPLADVAGRTRYVDYIVRRRSGDVAVELNGENFHHPAAIGQMRYESQLLKQNSLVARGVRVFRWSIRGMQERERFLEELGLFIGPGREILDSPVVRARRQVKSLQSSVSLGGSGAEMAQEVSGAEPFSLREHQQDMLCQIDRDRRAGASAFVVTLPTGTGKTEIALADFERVARTSTGFRGLFLVPTRHLRAQTLQRCRARLPDFSHSEEVIDSQSSGFVVQTYAWASRHLPVLEAACFDYLVIDEAHHVMAPMLRRVVEHLRPRSLLGLTATPERLDGQQIEEVLGSYQTSIDLSEAIQAALVPPVRAFRIETNIDLSQLRFRGRDYTTAELHRTVTIASRDDLIADTLSRYFPRAPDQPSGIIVFCVSVEHAERMARVLYGRGYRAVAVSGKYRDQALAHVDAFRQGNVDVLCACNLLTEGFDAPETRVLVMARPTLSKALYTQQIGRGMRWSEGKEAIYVIDVVDRYGPLNAPWTIHALLGQSAYLPFSDVVRPREGKEDSTEEQARLIELLEYERRIEELNIFTFERAYGDYLSEEQASRNLFTTKATLRSWVKKGEAEPSLRIPFGQRELFFFSPGRVEEIRVAKNLKVHDDSTQVADFEEFLEERNYTFSYKPVLLLAFLKRVDRRGGAALEDLREDFRAFYLRRWAMGLPLDKSKAAVSKKEALDSDSEVDRVLLKNPFEKFERRRFLRYAKDLSRIEASMGIWNWLSADPAGAERIRQQMLEDLETYYGELGGQLSRAEMGRMFPISGALQRAASGT